MLQECYIFNTEDKLSASTLTDKTDSAVSTFRVFVGKNYVTKVPSDFTSSGYKSETVEKILRAKNAPPAATFTSASEFLSWLNSPTKK